jgi:hypothetical protein
VDDRFEVNWTYRHRQPASGPAPSAGECRRSRSRPEPRLGLGHAELDLAPAPVARLLDRSVLRSAEGQAGRRDRRLRAARPAPAVRAIGWLRERVHRCS